MTVAPGLEGYDSLEELTLTIPEAIPERRDFYLLMVRQENRQKCFRWGCIAGTILRLRFDFACPEDKIDGGYMYLL